jgi:hypothetical protein
LGRLGRYAGDIALLVETGNHHGKSHRRKPNAKGETLARQIVRGYVRPQTGKTWVLTELE